MNIFRNATFNAEETTSPENTGVKREFTTFEKVVLVSAGVGIVAIAANQVLNACDHVAEEAKAAVAGVKAAKAKKATKEAVEIATFRKSLIDAGMSEAAADALVAEKYGK